MKIQFVLILLLSQSIHANESNESNSTIDLSNVSLEGLDENVSNNFIQIKKLIFNARDKQDRETELLASMNWCMLLHNFDFLEQAMSCYYIIGLDDKENAKWPYLYANSAMQKGDFDSAIKGLSETIKREKNYLPAYYYLIKYALNKNQISEAFDYLSQVPSTLQQNSSFLDLKGDMHKHIEQYYVAIGFYKQALVLVPQAKSLNYKIAKSYQALQQIKKANKFFDDTNASTIKLIDPYFQEVKSKIVGEIPYLIKAKASLLNGAYNLAIEDYEKALQYNPESETALVNSGVSFFKLKKIDNAIDYFQRALKLNPRQLTALFNMAYISSIKKQWNDAIAYYERYNKINLTDQETSSELAKIYYQQQRYSKVMAITQLPHMRTHFDTQFLKAQVYIQQEKYLDAINWLKEINQNHPNDFKILMALSKILSQAPSLAVRDSQQSLTYISEAFGIKQNEQSYWQLILVLDENNKCTDLNKRIHEFSEMFGIKLNHVVETVKQERRANLRCVID